MKRQLAAAADLFCMCDFRSMMTVFIIDKRSRAEHWVIILCIWVVSSGNPLSGLYFFKPIKIKDHTSFLCSWILWIWKCVERPNKNLSVLFWQNLEKTNWFLKLHSLKWISYILLCFILTLDINLWNDTIFNYLHESITSGKTWKK